MTTNRESQNVGSKSPGVNSLLSQEHNLAQKSYHDKSRFDSSGSDNLTLPVAATSANTVTSSQPNSPKPMTTESSPRIPWWQTWQIWGIVLVILSGGIGYGATSMLLRLPQTKTCSNVFWPVASAAVRIYCAQNLAEQQTVDDYLSAIALVEKLPSDHPLRSEINRNVEKWATGILDIGETKFQEGNLEAAIAIAREIPDNVEAKKIVDTKITDWQTLWSDAEDNYNRVESHLRAAKWNEAFSSAIRLADVRNDYWSTVKYQEAIDNINIAQEESATLDKAVTQLQQGSLDNLFAAIKKAEAISEDSYAYTEAQDILAQGKSRILALADEYITQQKWSKLLTVTYNVPGATLGIAELVQEWKTLANAGTSANLGSVLNLEDAIVEAEKLTPEDQLYAQAQQLINRWTLEIEDARHFDQANQFAQGRNITSYNAAISELKLIPKGNPRYSKAQQQINQWRGEIRIIQDRPVIARAKELAAPANVTAWRRAIAEINLVSSNSPLYREARKYAGRWQSSIERVEDQPILDRAISLGNLKNYQQAIQTARQIKSGRALSSQARKKITLWQQEIKAQDYLQQAIRLANQRTPDSLAKAIRTIRQIPSGTSSYYQVVPNVNDWSTEMVVIAERTSYYSLEEALAIARKIPSGTAGYRNAQSLIKVWEEKLNPPPVLQKKSKPVLDLKLDKNKPEN